MFIGRERELDSLNRLYTSDKFEFALRTSAEIFWSIKQGSRQTQPFLHFRRRWSMCLSWLKMRG